ncbi:hypothetical protein AVEN_195077-1 [Araneus ventricosus]|uniref:Uncharacterized protein n=1 Tax=Araneus ventricosus TaxID=182803 RepID=A0A4Y2BHX9_ARAVE|nr:hypothetical protein AVEN_195077-1 [Araneus ventricosus]
MVGKINYFPRTPRVCGKNFFYVCGAGRYSLHISEPYGSSSNEGVELRPWGVEVADIWGCDEPSEKSFGLISNSIGKLIIKYREQSSDLRRRLRDVVWCIKFGIL